MNWREMAIRDLRQAIGRREIRAQELVQNYLTRISAHEPKINSFITLNEKALERAALIDAAIERGEDLGPLAGLPVGVKDMLCTRGLRTTAGSRMLHNFVPPYSATVVERLEAAGAIVIGKLNQDEFAMGSSNETSFFGPCKNPWNLECVPGGSSGGSAAAVAADLVPVSIGTDTGGSIRQPASFCGVVGVKPTYGRVSRYGVVAFASSLDQVGPMGRTVADCAQILEVISGADQRDMTTADAPVPRYSAQLKDDLRGLRVGVPTEYFGEGVAADVLKVFEGAVAAIRDAGATIVEISLPRTSVAVPIYYIIATCEASSNLARYDGVRFGYRADFSKEPPKDLSDFYCRNRGEGFGLEVKRRIMLGTFALSSGFYDAYYKKAGQVRRLLRQDFIDAFERCDAILGPVSATPAFRIGERIDDPLAMYKNDIYTTATNLAGLPGMSVPGGFSQQGLPIGVQIMARHFDEQTMLNVAFAVENRLDMKGARPDGFH